MNPGFSQNWLVGNFGAEKSEIDSTNNVLSYKIYQADNIVQVDRNSYPEYYRGLPEEVMTEKAMVFTNY